MLALQSYFNEAGTFSKLFEASAGEARKSALLMRASFKSSPEVFDVKSFFTIERQNEKIYEEIASLLCQSYFTPIDWKDLDALSQALYRIPKTIYKYSLRMVYGKSHLSVDYFIRQANLLTEATGLVQEMVRQLWHEPQLPQIEKEKESLCSLEAEADKLILENMRNSYRRECDAMQIIFLSDLFQFLEKAIAQCRDAGNVVYRIVLKNS